MQKQSGTVVTLVAMASPPELPIHEREILQVLRRRGGKMWALDLIHICKANREALAALERQGYLLISEEMA